MNKQERFLELYEPCRSQLWRFIISFINNRFDAKDLMSDTILIAFENFDKLNEERAFLSYLFTTARRLIYRRTLFNRKIDGSIEFTADDIANDDFSPEKINRLNELNSALDKLPKKHKEAVVLTAIHGFSYEEAAEIQQKSVENIRKRIYRAKQKLKELLD